MFSKRLLTLTQALYTLHTLARLQKCLGIVKGKKKQKQQNKNEGEREDACIRECCVLVSSSEGKMWASL